jgi:hypothetical protein
MAEWKVLEIPVDSVTLYSAILLAIQESKLEVGNRRIHWKIDADQETLSVNAFGTYSIEHMNAQRPINIDFHSNVNPTQTGSTLRYMYDWSGPPGVGSHALGFIHMAENNLLEAIYHMTGNVRPETTRTPAPSGCIWPLLFLVGSAAGGTVLLVSLVMLMQ